ncbi:isoprenylcysteine carboxylmethyltransferase family protein [Maricaulaceae bacterium EIL42A08]|nr:isoprenylcysteine carboxylmethyltransferase family protein [Maricaulaceae bacterium EIL42A08]
MKLIIPPPVQGLITGIAMWGVSQAFPGFGLSFPIQKLLAGALIAVGVGIEITAVTAFFRARTTITPLKPSKTSALVVKGLYRISRNPMYLGLALLLTGWMVWLGNPLNLVLLGGFIGYITAFQIKPEEAALREKFGTAYDEYCAVVRRWI